MTILDSGFFFGPPRRCDIFIVTVLTA